MNFESIKNELREIVNTPARELTLEQKNRVQAIVADLGIEFERPKKGCGSCYHDAAMKCYNRATEMQAAENETTDDRRYILKPGVDVFFGNIRVNETTITDDLAEAILARGFERKFFAKICE